METVIVDNTGFNIEYWCRYSLFKFIEETMASGFYKHYSYEKRIELLTIVYNLIKENSNDIA